MARNVIGIKVHLQTLPTLPLQAQLNITLAQGDIDSLVAGQKAAALQVNHAPQSDEGVNGAGPEEVTLKLSEREAV
jgi:hypothetical protein